MLGAGLGGNRREFEEFGESFDTERRWQLLEEGLALIRELWAGPLGPREIPIWIGGNSTRARRLAARYDGWLPDSTTPEEMRMSPEDVRDEAQQRDRRHGLLRAGRQHLHGAYAQTGTTWWLESLHDRRCRTTRCSRACARVPRLVPEHTREGDMAVNVDVAGAARDLRKRADSNGRRIRRGAPRPQRAHRPPPGGDRPLPQRRRRRGHRALRTRVRPRRLRPRGRPQRRRSLRSPTTP